MNAFNDSPLLKTRVEEKGKDRVNIPIDFFLNLVSFPCIEKKVMTNSMPNNDLCKRIFALQYQLIKFFRNTAPGFLVGYISFSVKIAFPPILSSHTWKGDYAHSSRKET